MFGQRVKKLRTERGLTQPELAALAGLTKDTISNWERGRRVDPPISAVRAIADALGVSVADLLTEPEPETEVARA